MYISTIISIWWIAQQHPVYLNLDKPRLDNKAFIYMNQQSTPINNYVSSSGENSNLKKKL